MPHNVLSPAPAAAATTAAVNIPGSRPLLASDMTRPTPSLFLTTLWRDSAESHIVKKSIELIEKPRFTHARLSGCDVWSQLGKTDEVTEVVVGAPCWIHGRRGHCDVCVYSVYRNIVFDTTKYARNESLTTKLRLFFFRIMTCR